MFDTPLAPAGFLFHAILPYHLQELEDMLAARLLLAQGKTEDALGTLKHLQSGAVADGRLRNSLGISALQNFVRALLQMSLFEQATPGLAVSLSRQEQRVLILLASRRSSLQIAEELVVSVNTVKMQLKQVYRTLRVGSRQEACEIVRHLHLL